MKDDSRLREMILQMINICTRVTTLVFALSTLTQYEYLPVKDVWYIILIGVISAVSYCIFYIPKKIGKKLMVVIQILYFAIINVSVLLIGKKRQWLNLSDKKSFIIMEGMIVLVYILVTASCYILDYRNANKMNDKLKERKRLSINNSL